MKDELRKIPFKNYVFLGVVLLVSMLILYYFYLWVDAYNESKLNKPIMNKYMDVINYNELDTYLIENPDTIIYVSILENKEIRDFEKNFKKLFRKKKINNDILYLDITEDINNEEIKNELSNKYMINSVSILNVPVIIVIENGNVKSIYSISENNYDVDKVKTFINGIKFEEK